ncbi:plasmid replication, integration and excision activator [Protofrankia symbiont of Coriaria ruscifolia]|uniref:plasmid replication, integration and excision activator n=1 Tax=Protofrankia symbiont of Coriaria ruscifolia TaxID=1306542 RepID=UPI00104137C9|nr:plasmid replication, integration and excision activator [Protofrankia symbiont of Coriaria ruscifolia]
MAIPQRIPVAFGDVFPHGAYVLGVEAVNDFDKAKAGVADAQERDKITGELVWAVRVMDADPNARAGSAEVKVKIAAAVRPVPPEPLAGTPFRPVEFDGLTLTPYVNTNGSKPRQGFALRATGMRPVRTGSSRAAA